MSDPPAMHTRYSKPAGDLAAESRGLAMENARLRDGQRRDAAALAGRPERAACLLCGAGLENAPWFDHRGVGYRQCAGCGHVQTRVQPPPGYPAAPGQPFAQIYPRLDPVAYDDRARRIYAPKRDWILDCAPLLGTDRAGLLRRSWLELGCGAGYFLHTLQQAGATDVAGLDASRPLVDSANAVLARPTARHSAAGLADAVAAHPADIYVAWFVLEHIDDPRPFWAAMAAKPTGTVFCFSVPTFGLATLLEGATPDVYARNLDSVLHCQLYTDRSIARALNGAGYDLTAQWVFGQDAMDLRRLLAVSLSDRCAPELLAELTPALNDLVDPLQAVVDRAGLADARHVIAVKR
jgi:SAM-dependent methyltransferase